MLGRQPGKRGDLASACESLDIWQLRQEQGSRDLSNSRNRLEEFPLTLHLGMPIDMRADLLLQQSYLLVEVGDCALDRLLKPFGRRAFESVGVLMSRLLHRLEIACQVT